MAFNTFKDLKKKDKVKYENALDGNQKRITGEGEIYGFGRFGQTDLVWVTDSKGELHSLTYEDVKKI